MTTINSTTNILTADETDLREEFESTNDPIDRLCTFLVSELQRTHRITLGTALQEAKKAGLSAADALAAVGRVAGKKDTQLQRYFIDRSTANPQIIPPQSIALRCTESDHSVWAANVEVVWARTPSEALGK